MKIFSVSIILIFAFSNASVCFAQDLNPSQQKHLSGYWKFQDRNDLTKASVGNDLKLTGTHQWVDGPTRSDTAVRIAIGSYYRCDHNIAPNGGGDSVNRYTLMFDFRILSWAKWHTFHQTDTTNTNDGECFIRPITGSNPGKLGVAATGYSKDSVVPYKWYRLMISVNLGNYYRYYINGKLFHEGDTQDIDDRFALNPYLLLFADNNQEDDTIDIASVAVFDTCLSAADIADIGSIDPCELHPVSVRLGNDTLICGTDIYSVQLEKGYTYKWSNNDTGSLQNFSSMKFGSGVKQIWVSKKDENNCEARDTVQISFYPYPTPNLGRDTQFCEGNKLKITAGSASGNSYTWRRTGSNYTLSKVNFYTVDSTGQYTVEMRNSSGCTAFDSVNVTVNPNPVKPTLSSNGKDFCSGDTALIQCDQNFYNYTWSNGDTSKNINVLTGGKYKVMGRSQYGCISPWSDSLVLQFHKSPDKPVINLQGDTSLCEGDSLSISVDQFTSQYLWNDGYTFKGRYVQTPGPFSVRTKDMNGCLSEESDKLYLKIKAVPDKPGISVPLGKTDICTGDTFELVCDQIEAYYDWNNGKMTKGFSSSAAGSYCVRTRTADDCQSPYSDTITIVVHQPPAKAVIVPYGKDSIGSKTEALRYLWIIQGSPDRDSVKVIKAVNNTTYYLVVGDEWCWSEASSAYLFMKTGLDESFKNAGILMYPNPAAEGFNIELPGNIRFQNCSIYDANGRLVFERSDLDNTGILYIDTKGISGGIYHIRLISDSEVFSGQILIK